MQDQRRYKQRLIAGHLADLEVVANGAVRKAAAAVSRLLGTRIPMSAIRARGVPADSLAHLIDDPEALIVAVYMKVDGDVPGHAALLCSHPTALALADSLLGRPAGQTFCLDELELSALHELGNILTSSYLNALCERTGMALLPHPPQIAVDMAHAIASAIVVGAAGASHEAISIVTEFGPDTGPLRGHFLYIPESGAADAPDGSALEAA